MLHGRPSLRNPFCAAASHRQCVHPRLLCLPGTGRISDAAEELAKAAAAFDQPAIFAFGACRIAGPAPAAEKQGEPDQKYQRRNLNQVANHSSKGYGRVQPERGDGDGQFKIAACRVKASAVVRR